MLYKFIYTCIYKPQKGELLARLDPINVKYWKLVHSASDLGTETPQDYACRCDICGDSAHSRSKKRLHLFTKSGFDGDAIKCWNCDYTGNMYSYLRDYHPSLFPQFKKENQSEGFNRLVIEKETKPTSAPLVIDNIITQKMTELEAEPKPDKLVQEIPLPNLKDFPEAVQYLRNRGIEPKEDWLYSLGTLAFDAREFSLPDYIVIPLKWKNGLWYGFQALAFKKKDFRVVLLPENIGWKVWNWSNIKKDEPVYITESVYDTLSTFKPNAIAQMGAQLSKDRIDELKEPIFCLDNNNIDDRARIELINYAKAGHKVFVWPKKVPHKVKDFNDLVKMGATKEQINSLIDNNIYKGMEALLKLTL